MGLCGFCAADGQEGEAHSDLCVAQRLTDSAVAAAYRAISGAGRRSMRRGVALEVLAYEARQLVDVVRRGVLTPPDYEAVEEVAP